MACVRRKLNFIFFDMATLLLVLMPSCRLQSSIFDQFGKFFAAIKKMRSSSIIRLFARVVKLVYTAGLKPAAANPGMPVRFRSLAP